MGHHKLLILKKIMLNIINISSVSHKAFGDIPYGPVV